MYDEVVPSEHIESKIYFVRDMKVMLDRDLASLYGVSTKAFNQAVNRNIARFPEDFMFKLTAEEVKSLRSQFVTSNVGRGGIRYLPQVFTEYGVAMLSSVLKSEQAILVNIQVIRTFGKLRKMVAEHDFLRRKIETIELQYDQNFKIIFDAIRGLIEVKEETKHEIGFQIDR